MTTGESEGAMRFCVKRASATSDNAPPCEGAQRGTITYTQTWRVIHRGWYTYGANHRETVKRGVTWYSRDVTMDAWFIELADLEALLAFQSAEGSIILRQHMQDERLVEIVIYDDYME